MGGDQCTPFLGACGTTEALESWQAGLLHRLCLPPAASTMSLDASAVPLLCYSDAPTALLESSQTPAMRPHANPRMREEMQKPLHSDGVRHGCRVLYSTLSPHRKHRLRGWLQGCASPLKALPGPAGASGAGPAAQPHRTGAHGWPWVLQEPSFYPLHTGWGDAGFGCQVEGLGPEGQDALQAETSSADVGLSVRGTWVQGPPATMPQPSSV